ncbi:hypothetical protein SSX86_013019 [Deinandra increscens subsp. villosa]|uniref:DUF4220 domain-containing protein n=1 Tax=Deinandra increscens subsp. villosa TaxID=3103831 RepID=A0AAP0DCX7_9ASTR
MKNVEKTCALYLGSSEADAGSSYTKVIDEYISMKEANLPTKIIMIPEPYSDKSAKKAKKGKLTQLEVVQYGYEFYAKLKGLLNYRIYSRKERDQSRGFFSNRTPEDAFKVVEVELNFIYDVHFTKLPVVFAANKIGLISRVFSLAAIYVAIILFMLESKTNFKEVDVMITYGLLFGALVLDTSALIMLLFCDWTIIFLERYPTVKPDNGFKTKILTTCTEGALHRKFHRWRRWSNSISTFNLIYYCLHPRPRSWKVFDKLGLSLLADDIFYVKTENFSDNLRDFIFEQLKWRSELADDTEITKEINSGRGNWVVHAEHGWDSLYEIVGDVEYDQSLILWHVATEICYNNEGDPRRNDNKTDKSRRISKLLSDYMLYLLIIMQPNMMPAASSGMGQTRFRDTCEEAKRFLDERKRVGPSEC